jgi:DNA-binding transcriptional regulator LsrR (DeoR family)
MTQLDNRGQMVKAAQMYYLDGRGQDDIARVLGTSRSKVSRMLAAARAGDRRDPDPESVRPERGS